MTEQDADGEKRSAELTPSSSNDSTLHRLVARALENLPESDDSADRAMSVMLSEKYSGPFAHPDLLRKLDKVVDNGAERAFSLTEKEQTHRHFIDTEVLKSDLKHRDKEAFDRRLVIVLVFTFLLMSLVGAFVAIILGHPAGGGLVGGAGAIISGAALFIARSQAKKRN